MMYPRKKWFFTTTRVRTPAFPAPTDPFGYLKHAISSGLDIYDEITNCKEYYLYGSELAILAKYGPAMVRAFKQRCQSQSTQSKYPAALLSFLHLYLARPSACSLPPKIPSRKYLRLVTPTPLHPMKTPMTQSLRKKNKKKILATSTPRQSQT